MTSSRIYYSSWITESFTCSEIISDLSLGFLRILFTKLFPCAYMTHDLSLRSLCWLHLKKHFLLLRIPLTCLSGLCVCNCESKAIISLCLLSDFESPALLSVGSSQNRTCARANAKIRPWLSCAQQEPNNLNPKNLRSSCARFTLK